MKATFLALALTLTGCAGVPEVPSPAGGATLACNALGASVDALSEAYRGVLRTHSRAGWEGCASAVCRQDVVDQVERDWRAQASMLKAAQGVQNAGAAVVGPSCRPAAGPMTAETATELKREAAEPQ